MGKIIAVSNQKGGVGKTTTAINLASGLGYLGNKVLLVDFDPQGNATQGVGANVSGNKLSVYNLIMEDYEADAVRKTLSSPPIDIIPANISLAGADLQMVKFEVGKEELLKKKLDKIRDEYDFIIIDCPPSLGLLNTNALTAADSVIIPVQCEYYALEGVTQLLLTIRLVQQLFNEKLMIEGVVLTMFDARTKLSVEVQQEVRKHFKDRVYRSYIPRNIKLSEAPSRGMSIFEYDVRCEGAKAYAGLANEVVKSNRK
ncbi:MAG: ParA family protein [Erysipelotrichaceae bacterium]|jgi:chromosome partitioning protein|nr:ParA family protein [Erysipelotrichaceae bacterium]